MSKYTLEVQEDENGEMFFEFPDELMNQMGWDIGDTLIWEEVADGAWKLTKEQPDDRT